MHTSTYEVPGYGKVHVIHNGGWDGEAEIVWTEGEKDHRATVPAKLLVRIGMKVAVDFVKAEMIGVLERIGAPDGVHGATARDFPPPG